MHRTSARRAGSRIVVSPGPGTPEDEGLAYIAVNGSRPWDLQVHEPRFYDRGLQQAALGLGQSYMDGWWDCEQLDEFFFCFWFFAVIFRHVITLDESISQTTYKNVSD